MSWQEEDADGNRQGLTIAEYGEAGGPGMGGCPAGPGDLGAPQPGAASVVRSADKTSMSVKWTPATPVPGARRRHRLQRRGRPADPVGHRRASVVIGKRTGDLATGVNLTGLTRQQGL